MCHVKVEPGARNAVLCFPTTPRKTVVPMATVLDLQRSHLLCVVSVVGLVSLWHGTLGITNHSGD